MKKKKKFRGKMGIGSEIKDRQTAQWKKL